MIRWLFVPLCAFCILICLAWNNIAGLTLERSIKVSDLPSLLASLLVAYVLQYALLRTSKVKEIEKSLLSQRFDSIADHLTLIRQLLVRVNGRIPDATEAAAIVAAFEDCAEEINLLDTALEDSHCKSLNQYSLELATKYLRYKRAVTGGRFPNQVMSGGSIDEIASARISLLTFVNKLHLRMAKI